MTREPVARRPRVPDGYELPREPEDLLLWSHAVERLTSARNYWLATCRPSGAPHTTPVWGIWLDDALYLDGPRETRWGRNIAANPRVSVHLESADDALIVEGVARFGVTDNELGQRIAGAWDGKYGEFVPAAAAGGIFTVSPRRARAWHENPFDGTVWTFTDDNAAK